HRTAARLGVTREELLALIEASKRAQRARDEDEGAVAEVLPPAPSLPHKVRESATEMTEK
ncbi:MAG: hypothetical protein ABW133_14075, partial [Polyangiaceae bacterium]